MATALQRYLGADETPEAKTSKSVTKAVERLAAQLVTEHRKQARQTARQTKLDAKPVAKAQFRVCLVPVSPASFDGPVPVPPALDLNHQQR